MEAIKDVILDAVQWGVVNVSADTAQYFLLGVYIPSGITKFLIVPTYNELFPSLPDWFWPAAGAWEIAMAGLILTGRYDIAIPMSYTFLGGVISACTVLHPNNFFNIPVATAVAIITGIVGINNGIAVFPSLYNYLGAGFGFGVFMGKVIGSKKRAL